MSPASTELLDRILAFNIDGHEPVALPFVARLARENGWSRSYADRVLYEYKRYMFLAATSSEPVCPSEDVDAAWHLHLTYTRNYWKRFCGEVLGTPLHHDPTRGGAAEADKHLHMYERTLATYRAMFGTEPPADIWPPAVQRFGQDLKHRMVNTAHNWVIPKDPIKRILGITAAGLTVAAFVPGCVGGNFNPFDLVGANFLTFLIPVMIAAVCVGRVIRSRMRMTGPQPSDDDVSLTWEQVAYLSGGYPRLITAAIARLVENGAAVLSEDKSRIVPGPYRPSDSFSPVERVVLTALPLARTPTDMKQLNALVQSEFDSQAVLLEQEGFVLSLSRRTGIYLGSAMPLLLVLLLLAVPRLVMGIESHKPVGYLLATIVIGGFTGMFLSLIGTCRLSKRGENLLVRLRGQHDDLRTGSDYGMAGSTGLAVALFGTAVLTVSGMNALEAWFPRQTSKAQNGCGSGCGGGCGGGGCGGGGCGGGCGG
jgi:uncharacterized protein (TIGR04222 family)